MTDLHCSLLSQMDNGFKKLEDSLLMASKVVRKGVALVTCRLHYNTDFYNPKEKMIQSVSSLAIV